jgi:hypothetical protein
MADADGGTPQRFLWLPTTDPGVPDTTPEAPEPKQLPDQQWSRGNFPKLRLVVPDVAAETICDTHRARLRGQGAALDGHALLCRAISEATRSGVVARLAEQANIRTEAQGRADGVRADAAAQSSDERAARRVSARLLGKVVSGGECSRTDARNAIARRDRVHFDAALERLIAAGQVDVFDVEHGQRIKPTGVSS